MLVGFDAVSELVEVGAQTQGSLQAGEAFLSLEAHRLELPGLGGTEGAPGVEQAVAKEFAGLDPFGAKRHA